MMNKLKAFTLMELLVGMVISAILISFCYASYGIVYRQYLAYKAIKQQVVNTMELNAILSDDFIHSEIMYYDEKKLMVNRKNNMVVEYDFDDAFILRKENETIDTFHIITTDIAAMYEDEPKLPPFFLKDFSFHTQFFKEDETFHYLKNYSAETILNHSDPEMN